MKFGDGVTRLGLSPCLLSALRRLSVPLLGCLLAWEIDDGFMLIEELAFD